MLVRIQRSRRSRHAGRSPSRWLIALTAIAVCAGCGTAGITAAPRRAAYVRDVSAFIARAEDRMRLAQLVADRRVTDVIPYGIGSMLTTPSGRDALARWIGDLHRLGARVVVPIAGSSRLHGLRALIDQHPTLWLDGLVTEYEYWNRADRAPAFDELMALVAAMRAHAAVWQRGGHPVSIGAYLGYPTAREAARIAAVVDAVYLDYTVRDPAVAWGHVRTGGGPLPRRLGWFACAGVEVWPIFYAAGEVHMGTALRTRGVGAAEARFLADMAQDHRPCPYRVAGFAYFTIEALSEGQAWQTRRADRY